MYDLIYANGDSYTQGNGTAQHMYLDMPPLSGYEVTDKIRKKAEKMKERCTEDFHSVELANSYVAQLGKIASIPYENKALGGSGLGNICLTASIDLMNLNNTGKKVLALIGLTNPNRVFWPAPKPNNTLLFSAPGLKPSMLEKNVLKHHAKYLTYEQLAVYSSLPLLGLIELSKNLQNVDLHLIETPAFPLSFIDQDGRYDDLISIIQSKILDTLVPNYNKGDKIHTCCNHVFKEVHEALAKRIYKKIWN